MKKSTILWTALACLALCVAAWAQATSPGIPDILRQARNYQFQFRAGQRDVAPKAVALLDEATKANPENADLWQNMGFACLLQAVDTMLTGGKPADAWASTQKGQKALERALELNPDHAEALAIHGGLQAAMGSLSHAPQLAAAGFREMNRAVELAPKSTRAHLARAFNGLILPEELRNHAAEAEDLDFLIQAAGASRSGDYIRIMRGDLFFELGNPELAKEQYEAAGKSGSEAATDAVARLSALAQGAVPLSDIQTLRNAAGANCVMCHGR